MAQGLFRDQAVAAYQSPETRGGLLALSPPSGRAVAWTLLALVVGAVAAASVIRVRVTAEGNGLVRAAGGNVEVGAPRAGTLSAMLVKEGERVDRGARLFRVGRDAVAAPRAGIVDRIDATVGDSVAAHSTLLEIIPTDVDLVGEMAIPARYRARLSPGDAVRLRISEYPGAGDAQAAIERIGDDLLDRDRVEALTGRSGSEERFVSVRLRLLKMPPRSEGAFRSGMTFSGFASLGHRRAITLLLPDGMRL